MASTAEVTASVVTNNGTRDVGNVVASTLLNIASAVGDGTLTTLTLSSGFNALTVPTGAQAVLLIFKAGALTFTLKGVTADTGIVLQSGTLTSVPVLLPLGTSPSIGITASNTGGTVEYLFV